MAQMKIRGNTQIIAATITNTEISASAAIATSKLADAANFILRGGTIPFTAAQSMGGFKLTNVGAPAADTDAATKGYVDGFVTGVDWKPSVRVATTGPITLSATQTIDGVALSVGDRVLVKDQASQLTNGIYVVAAGAWTRATDADSSAEVSGGMTCWVNEGTTNADSQWILTTNDTVVLNTTALVFTQISGLGQILAGAGLTKTGNTIDVIAGNGIVVAADSVSAKINATTPGLALDANGLAVALSGTTIQKDASGVKVNPNLNITDLAASSVSLKQTLGDTSQISSLVAGVFDFNPGVVASLPGFSIDTGSLSAGRSYNVPDKSGTLMLVQDLSGEEVPTGLINSSNVTYTLANTPLAGSVVLYQNGIRLRSGAGNDYTISGLTITMLTAPVTGDLLLATYFK